MSTRTVYDHIEQETTKYVYTSVVKGSVEREKLGRLSARARGLSNGLVTPISQTCLTEVFYKRLTQDGLSCHPASSEALLTASLSVERGYERQKCELVH